MKLTSISNSANMLKNGSLLDSLTTQQISPVTQTNNNEITFAKFLKNSLSEVNDTQVKAYEAMEGIATGKVDNLQEAVRTIEEAELTLKLGLEVKNKALGAYKQIMAMQI